MGGLRVHAQTIEPKTPKTGYLRTATALPISGEL